MLHYSQGRSEGGGGKGAIHRAPCYYGEAEWLRWAPKRPNNVTSTFFNTVHLLPKNLSFEHGSQTCFLPGAPYSLVTPLTAVVPYRTSIDSTGSQKHLWMAMTFACI